MAALLAVLLASTPVAAQEPGPTAVVTVTETLPAAPTPPAAALDILVLRDGSVLRGTIAEVFQGREVTIVTVAGQRRTVAWDQVTDLRYGGAAPPQATTEPPPLVMGPGHPQLHIETTRPVRLFEISTQPINTPALRWGNYPQNQNPQARPVCRAPCDRVIDGSYGQSFYFGGEGITPSKRFTLDEHGGPMLARVRPGRAGVFVGGILFASMSVVPLISGTLFMALSSSSSSSAMQTRNAGITLSAVGVGMLVSGIVMIALGRTRMELYRRYTGAAQRRPKLGHG